MTNIADFTNALLAAGFIRVDTRKLGLVHPHTQHVYEKRGFEGSVEVVSNSHFNTITWAIRTAASAAGTGVRPVGGTSIKSMMKTLKIK